MINLNFEENQIRNIKFTIKLVSLIIALSVPIQAQAFSSDSCPIPGSSTSSSTSTSSSGGLIRHYFSPKSNRHELGITSAVSSTSSSSSNGSTGGWEVYCGESFYAADLCPISDATIDTDTDSINPDNIKGSRIFFPEVRLSGGPGISPDLIYIDYSNGTDKNLPMSLSGLNHMAGYLEIDFPPTGSWDNFKKISIAGGQGTNKIKLSSLTDEGGPNIKKVSISLNMLCGNFPACSFSKWRKNCDYTSSSSSSSSNSSSSSSSSNSSSGKPISYVLNASNMCPWSNADISPYIRKITFNNKPGSSIYFPKASMNVDHPSTKAEIEISYSNGDLNDKTLYLKDANESTGTAISFPSTGAWNKVRSRRIEVPYGEHEYRLVSEEGGSAPQIREVKVLGEVKWTDGFEYSIDVEKCGENADPFALIEAPDTAEAKTPLNFSAQSSYDPDGFITDYYWDFGNGDYSYEIAPYYAYPNPPSNEKGFKINLVVTDDLGNKRSNSHIIQFDKTAPKAVIEGPNQIKTGQQFSLLGNNSFDNDGHIVSYEWDFGDGQASTLVNPTHQYLTVPNSGHYTVSLTVTDTDGYINSSTKKMSVTANNCSGLPQFTQGRFYNTGDIVQANGDKYKCIVGGWCTIGVWAYTPGSGTYWQHAWSKLQSCDSAP